MFRGAILPTEQGRMQSRSYHPLRHSLVRSAGSGEKKRENPVSADQLTSHPGHSMCSSRQRCTAYLGYLTQWHLLARSRSCFGVSRAGKRLCKTNRMPACMSMHVHFRLHPASPGARIPRTQVPRIPPPTCRVAQPIRGRRCTVGAAGRPMPCRNSHNLRFKAFHLTNNMISDHILLLIDDV